MNKQNFTLAKPLPDPLTISESDKLRFWSKVLKSPDCWTWAGGKNQLGYGWFWLKGRNQKAHRIAYLLQNGEIPGNLGLDHLCRNPSCVNPSHLVPATVRDNTIRGFAPSANNSRKTHCPRGHPFSPDNLVEALNRRGERRCRECAINGTRRWRIRNKSKVDAYTNSYYQKNRELLVIKAREYRQRKRAA